MSLSTEQMRQALIDELEKKHPGIYDKEAIDTFMSHILNAEQDIPGYLATLETLLRLGITPKNLLRYQEENVQALQILEDFTEKPGHLREHFPDYWMYDGVTPESMQIFLSGFKQYYFDSRSKRDLVEHAQQYIADRDLDWGQKTVENFKRTIEMLEIYGTVVKYLDQIKLHDLAEPFLKNNAEATAALEACKQGQGNRDRLDQLIREAVKVIVPIVWKELKCANFLTPAPAMLPQEIRLDNPNLFYQYLSPEEVADFHKAFPQGVSEEKRKEVFIEALFRRLHRYIFRKVTAHCLQQPEDRPFSSRVFPLTFPTPSILAEMDAALVAKNQAPAAVIFAGPASASSSASLSASASSASSSASASTALSNSMGSSSSAAADASSSSTTSSRAPSVAAIGAAAIVGVAAVAALKKWF